jgi:hypothetical protein
MALLNGICRNNLQTAKDVFTLDPGEPMTKTKAYDASSIDENIDKFAEAMKLKMHKKAAQGFSGGISTDSISRHELSRMLRDHVDKGDPVDVGNFCMMFFIRQEDIA